jgi:glycosyltransferase involved in cell wall biosynthesis
LKAPIYISRKGLNIRSGAGQMIASQADYFTNQNYDVTVCCNSLSRGSLKAFGAVKVIQPSKFWRLFASRASCQGAMANAIHNLRAADNGIVIDHEPCIESADISYVHNFLAPEHASRIDGYMDDQHGLAQLWARVPEWHSIIANSIMVKQGLMTQFDLPDKRVEVIYPGYDSVRFNPGIRKEFREILRSRLGIGRDDALLGLVLSGEFHKRGLDRFLDCITLIKQEEPTLKALVLGARSCPDQLKEHELFRIGDVIYEKSTFVPEQYFAALDIFLLPARYEEFGIVVLESMAMGVPVVTSSAVGASEILRERFPQHILEAEEDSADEFCRRVVQLLRLDVAARTELEGSLSREAQRYSHSAHNERLASRVDALVSQRAISIV